MALTWKQKTVIDFINKSIDKQITKKQAMELINDHYANGAKHVGDCLSRMVNSGLLERVKSGTFTIGKGKLVGKQGIEENKNQTQLF